MTDADEFTAEVYYDEDADTTHIEDKTVAVLGYGSQGHAHALNLSDSGVDVALAAVTQDRDCLVLDVRRVRVLVVVDLRGELVGVSHS